MSEQADGIGSINVEEWLKSNKLSNCYDLFKSKSITIEEISELDNCDIEKFAQETLKLDTLSKRRFVSAINKFRQTNTKAAQKQHHIVVSSEEQQALTKLYERYNECSKQQIKIQKVINASEKELGNNLQKHFSKSIDDIDNIFDEIMKQLMLVKSELLKNINVINNKKQQSLTEQLNTLQNKYIPFVENGMDKYNEYTQGANKPLDIINFLNNILAFNGNSCPTTVMITQPSIKFHIDETMKVCDAFMNDIKIDDCDKPNAPKTKLLKVESDSILMEYDINKQYYSSINKSILKICIEYALIKNDDYLWSDYKADDYDNRSDSDSNDLDTDSESDSETDSDDHSKRKKKEKKKKKKKRKKREKIKLPKAKMKIINVKEIDTYDYLVWLNETFKVSKKSKKHDKKFKLTEKVKHNSTYIIRIKLLNESGWSQHTTNLYVVKTPKIYIDSKILKNKEKIKLKRMVNGQLMHRYNKWKLLFRSTKHGYTGQNFHQYCDGKRRTVSIIETNAGNVFGGYTEIAWQSTSGKYIPDAKAFVFLIRSTRKYKPAVFGITRVNKAVLHNSSFPCMFGNKDIACQQSFNGKRSRTRQNSYSIPSPHYLNGDVQYFTVKELETFQLK